MLRSTNIDGHFPGIVKEAIVSNRFESTSIESRFFLFPFEGNSREILARASYENKVQIWKLE